MLILYGTLALCTVVVVLLIYRYDLYDKEPWYMALLAMLLGAGVMWTMGPIGGYTIAHMGDFGYTPTGIAIVAGVQEELGKLAVVLFIAIVFRGVFNDPLDGLIYGSLAGLGAAVEESVGVLTRADAHGVLPGAEFVRLVGHSIMGGITGYGVGMWVIKHPRRVRIFWTCLGVSILLHTLWDVVAGTQTQAASMHSLAGAMLMLIGLVIFGRLTVIGAEYSRLHFNKEHHHRFFGWPFSKLF